MPSLSEMINERKAKVANLDPYAVSSMLANQAPNQIEQGLSTQIQSGNPFQVHGAELLGNRASDIYNQRLGGVKSSILRNAVFADADRDARTSEVADAYKRQKDEEWLLAQQRKAAKRAKKKGLVSGIAGVAGAVGAGLLTGGNPYAIQAGGGIGTMIGGS